MEHELGSAMRDLPQSLRLRDGQGLWHTVPAALDTLTLQGAASELGADMDAPPMQAILSELPHPWPNECSLLGAHAEACGVALRVASAAFSEQDGAITLALTRRQGAQR